MEYTKVIRKPLKKVLFHNSKTNVYGYSEVLLHYIWSIEECNAWFILLRPFFSRGCFYYLPNNLNGSTHLLAYSTQKLYYNITCVVCVYIHTTLYLYALLYTHGSFCLCFHNVTLCSVQKFPNKFIDNIYGC